MKGDLGWQHITSSHLTKLPSVFGLDMSAETADIWLQNHLNFEYLTSFKYLVMALSLDNPFVSLCAVTK
jgi:uncharacterized protein (DUF486 family)